MERKKKLNSQKEIRKKTITTENAKRTFEEFLFLEEKEKKKELKIVEVKIEKEDGAP
jgi:hypothetical protein